MVAQLQSRESHRPRLATGLALAAFVIVGTSYALNAMDRQVFSVLLPQIRNEYSFGLSTGGLLSTIFGLGVGAGALVAGFLSDRYSRKWVMLAGILGFQIANEKRHNSRVDNVLELLQLTEVRDATAGTLPTGTLRLVELGRALCHDPRVLLLDEPASGLDTEETVNLQRVLRELADNGTAVLLVEHDVDLVFDVADQVFAMAEGRLLASGAADEVRAHPAVQEAYLDVSASTG